MIWCGNFNRHHPLWDEERNNHLFTASAALAVQLLMSLIEDYNMVMILPKNILTLQSLATKNWTRVDNVFATANTEELVVICDMDPRLMGPGTDHVPMLTTLEISIPQREETECRNFREVDWEKFREELESQLGSIPEPCTLIDEAQFQRVVSDLTRVLQLTIEAVVPILWPSPHLHRWWSKELSQMKKNIN